MYKSHFEFSDISNYFLIEYYHLLENNNINKLVIENTESPIVDDFIKLLKDFYSFLLMSKYSVTHIHLHQKEKHNYKEDEFNEFINETYGSFKQTINSLIYKLIDESPLEVRMLRKTADDFENYVILSTYSQIGNGLTDILNDHPGKKLNLISNQVNKSPDNFKKHIFNRFIKNRATAHEINDEEFSHRILINKSRRFHERKSAWNNFNYNKGEEPSIQNNIDKFVRSFLSSEQQALSVMADFVLLMLAKYHITLHKYWGSDFRNLKHHLIQAKELKKSVERAQYTFSFIRTIVKYYPDMFKNVSNDHYQFIAKIIEILSYIRRGVAYEMLGEPEKAFNDYSWAENHVNQLNNISKVINKSVSNDKSKVANLNQPVFLCYFRNLTVPYIYSLKGELYRRNFAFYNAHQYYCNSMNNYDKWLESNRDSSGIKVFLKNCIKIGRICMAKGKTFFELGEFRKALKWHIRGVRDIFATIKGNDLKAFNNILNYFEETRLDGDINKRELHRELTKVTNYIESYFVNTAKEEEMEGMAIILSELFNCISMIIYIFNLPDYNYNGKIPLESKRDMRDSLAITWLCFALKLNQFNYMARFNEIIYQMENYSTYFKSNLQSKLERFGIKKHEDISDDLITPGEPREIAYRLIVKKALAHISKPSNREKVNKTKEGAIALGLMHKLLMFTDDFSTRNAELCKYLLRKPVLNPQKFNTRSAYNKENNITDEVRMYFLRRWSSINPAVPRPSAFMMRGGGYFITYKGKGIAIDPGIKFLENLYSEGFSVADIDYIITTHDHIDHIADIDTIMSLHYRRCKLLGEKKRLFLLLNPSMDTRYGFLVNQDPKLFQKMELSPIGGRMTVEGLDDFAIQAVPVLHKDICSPRFSKSIGLILTFFPGEPEKEIRIGMTGDTRWCNPIDYKHYRISGNYDEQEPKPILKQFFEGDNKDYLNIIIANINGTPFRELKAYCEIELNDRELKSKLKEMEDNEIFKDDVNQLKYSLGYRIEADDEKDDEDKNNENEDKKRGCGEDIDAIFKKITKANLGEQLRCLDGQHMFLHGILHSYKEFSEINTMNKEKLFVVAETSEEMGSYRNKVAFLMNEQFSKKNNTYCLTADIGLVLRITPGQAGNKTNKDQEINKPKIEVRCSKCSLSNDYSDADKYHSIKHINEVCLKWEEEGLMYFCHRHDPQSDYKRPDELEFIEKLERYQPLRHMEIRVR